MWNRRNGLSSACQRRAASRRDVSVGRPMRDPPMPTHTHWLTIPQIYVRETQMKIKVDETHIKTVIQGQYFITLNLQKYCILNTISLLTPSLCMFMNEVLWIWGHTVPGYTHCHKLIFQIFKIGQPKAMAVNLSRSTSQPLIRGLTKASLVIRFIIFWYTMTVNNLCWWHGEKNFKKY